VLVPESAFLLFPFLVAFLLAGLLAFLLAFLLACLLAFLLTCSAKGSSSLGSGSCSLSDKLARERVCVRVSVH